ncbi:MAG: hypothetical protein ACOYLH_05695 [Flavobacteriales bacterium]
MKKIYYSLLLTIALCATEQSFGQVEKKFSVNGAARGIFYGDRLDQDVAVEDSVTIPRLNSGHVLVDLGLNIRPVKTMEIQAMLRVRNDYGGFWGSGVTFDIRQLYVKGVIGGIVRYQLGDINYKMTRYTMWNYNQELSEYSPAVFGMQTDLVNYDHFYNKDNSWRQQGGAAEFGLVFSKYVKELQFHAVTSRMRMSDNSSVNDRMFSGFNIELVQSDYVKVGYNWANVYDISGTSRNNNLLRNPVGTITAKVNVPVKQFEIFADAEAGRSKSWWTSDSLAPEWNGEFFDGQLGARQKDWGLTVSARFKRVDFEFRSAGSQTKRIDFSTLPTAYQRITNDQVYRNISMLDLMRESSLYNLQLSNGLGAYNPKYDNITPYGEATPNRMGSVYAIEYAPKKWPVKLNLEQSMLTEVRGQGTTEVKSFTRTNIRLAFEKTEFLKSWKNRVFVGASYRMDQTSRGAGEYYRAVDLASNVMSIGAEIEVFKQFDVLLGYQSVAYSGFDFEARKNAYGETFNFAEYTVDGNESMRAIGLRYRFNDRAFLNAQYSAFQLEDEYATGYRVDQIMLLYQMNF